MLIEMSCIVSIRFFWRPECIRVSRVNSNISQSVAKDKARENIRIAARSGEGEIRWVFWRTNIIARLVNPRARDAVNVIVRLHHNEPE